MKVIISAGGTGGHIYPALAIVNKIKEKEPESSFLYIGTHNRMEKDIVPKHDIPFEPIEIYGFNKRNILKNFKTIYMFLKSLKRCRKLIKNFNPDIVIGVGGYVTGPVIYEAHKLKYKTLIHEQNSIPGKSNKFLSRYTDKIAVSFKSSMNFFPKNKVVFTGNPCSEYAKIVEDVSKTEFGLTEEKKLVYIVMGSLGASNVSDIIVKSLNLFKDKNYEVLFITGDALYQKVSQSEYPSNVKIVPYIDNQVRILKKADLVVTRCGATTLSEIIALKIPSILIPSPYVPNNHQYKNALDLVNNKSAILIEEKDLNKDILVSSIDKLINDEDTLKSMKISLKELDIDFSATKIYQEIKSIIDRK